MTETLETLSAPQQELDVDYFHRVLNFTDKAVIAAPCGWGKTVGMCAYMAENYRKGILYVAERKEQLEHVQERLIKAHGVPEEDIGCYHGGNTEQLAQLAAGVTKPIALLTYSRIQSHHPGKYVFYPANALTRRRQCLIVDEAIPPLIILSAPELFIEGWLRRMGVDWNDLGSLGPEDMETRINRLSQDIVRHAAVPFKNVGIDYLDWTNYLRESDLATEIRAQCYRVMLTHILHNHFVRDHKVNVLIPMVPHISWYQMFDAILVLDATAHLCDYMYQDYAILRPGTWNFEDIHLALKFYTSFGSPSKTKIRQHQEAFLNQMQDTIVPSLAEQGFDHPYIVTFKTLGEESFPETVSGLFGGQGVQNYGGTRGSNAFRQCDSAILIGSYKPPVAFNTLALTLFGSAYSSVKYAVSHWLQEIYRTRIRQYEGAPIHIFLVGEQDVMTAFEQSLGTGLHPISISQDDDPQYLERILRGLQYTLQKQLFDAVIRDRVVSLREFANVHAQRNVSKVQRACRGILQKYPSLEGHLVMDESSIRLVDKTSPL